MARSDSSALDVIDVLFVAPGNAKGIYQSLADKYAAIEPPTWALLLAESVRSVGYSAYLIDANAERLSAEEVAQRVSAIKPRLVVLVVYGQNVNAGTVGMSGAMRIASALKSESFDGKVFVAGSHVQALPTITLQAETHLDGVFTNEGVYALRNLIRLSKFDDSSLAEVRGIAFRDSSNNILINPPEALVPRDRMDLDLPGYAWDLLPFNETPFDLYRAPLWHADYIESDRSPYAAIQTSLGCNFGCSFCMINIVNRNDNAEIGIASNYSGMRHWSPEFVLKQFDILAEYGVRTIRIVDEMFLLYKKYYLPICEGISQRAYARELRLWAYSRIDTVSDPDILSLVRKAGIRWLALGIESASHSVRLEVSKGKFEDVDIRRVIEQIHEADISVMGNYIVGLPGDTHESMRATLDLSLDLNTAGWNMYAAMAIPGSDLYASAIQSGVDLPKEYEGYSFHSYETLPLPTESLTPAEILEFRDRAFVEYHSNPSFLKHIEERFGSEAARDIKSMTKVKLRRRILEEGPDGRP